MHIIHETEMVTAMLGGVNVGATILVTGLCVLTDIQQFPEGNRGCGHRSSLGPLLSRWGGHLFGHKSP